ncbi:MAG: glycosyl transferase [Candidatus Binatia bacterium]|nr:MAG: glycosyl transferase [Candidatus Binatia bacterium]
MNVFRESPNGAEGASAAGAARHVAVFLSELSGGGAQRRTVTLVNGFAARGMRVDLVLVRAAGPLLGEVSREVHVVELESVWARRPPFSAFRRGRVLASIGALADYLRSVRPDVLLSAASHVNLAACLAYRQARVPLPLVLRVSNHLSRSSWNLRRSPRLLTPILARELFPSAAALIAVSRSVADDLVRVTGLPSEKVHVIYNPVVDERLFRKAREMPDHPWFADSRMPVVLGAGRFVKQKDFPTLLRAFARVRRERPAKLVVLGSGKPRRKEKLEKLAAKLGIREDVDFPGFVENPYAYMARASVFVLSSAWEGLPGVLVEAMACGCPVVATDCPGGSAEILDGGRYGPLVPVGDDRAMAREILRVLESPPPRDSLLERALCFEVNRQVDAYVRLLDRVLLEHRAGAGVGSGPPLRRASSA